MKQSKERLGEVHVGTVCLISLQTVYERVHSARISPSPKKKKQCVYIVCNTLGVLWVVGYRITVSFERDRVI